MPMDERVLVIPTARFMAAGYFHGFRRGGGARTSARSSTQPRSSFGRAAKWKPTHLQATHPVRRAAVRRGPVPLSSRLLGNRNALQALRSVGIGGHVSETDARDGEDLYTAGMRREVREEVAIECGWKEHHLGFINDDRTPVGSVHLGVVHLFELNEPRSMPAKRRWPTPASHRWRMLSRETSEFETWSQFVLEELQRGK